ncbi:ABC transporter ATP-binding protein [Marinococcus luteus]|uniref:ABC transporter ATP-binding protein n=1 Tax=Marinococcus luteus TaxID=1122204 RepID=UPI002ACC8B2E|nr:ABC transporter ATP-binding protein [Marinococcus luteus]MDZ5782669.1 ABC transporter ATP-binding protein [Marinococcus luteus]
MNELVKLEGVSKYFGKHAALEHVDLMIHQGETVGFLGPNGSGKSTTIRVMLGLLKKSGGEVKLFGKDAWTEAVDIHKRVAYVPGDVNVWPNLTGGQVIDVLGKLHGDFNEEKRQQLIERFQLDPRKKSKTYSKGNRQKLALITAFASEADLYIFDEPTSGLDPLMASIFRECVRELQQEGKAVLLSSHILAEVEELCDRVSIIKEGKIIESGTLEELRHLTRISITAETKQTVASLAERSDVHQWKADESKVHFYVDAKGLAPVMQELAAAEVVSLESRPPTLEEIFLRHYESKAGEAG